MILLVSCFGFWGFLECVEVQQRIRAFRERFALDAERQSQIPGRNLISLRHPETYLLALRDRLAITRDDVRSTVFASNPLEDTTKHIQAWAFHASPGLCFRKEEIAFGASCECCEFVTNVTSCCPLPVDLTSDVSIRQ